MGASGEDMEFDEEKKRKMKEMFGEKEAEDMENNMKEMGRRRKGMHMMMKEWMEMHEDKEWKDGIWDEEKGEMKCKKAKEMFRKMMMSKMMDFDDEDEDDKKCKDFGSMFEMKKKEKKKKKKGWERDKKKKKKKKKKS